MIKSRKINRFNVSSKLIRQYDIYIEKKEYMPLIIIFLLAHLPLVLIMQKFPIVSGLHALATLVLGLIFIIIDKEPYRLVYLLAYITGFEVIWRATEAPIFWEYSKYEVSFLLILAILGYHKLGTATKLPLVSFILLLPSIFLMSEFDRQVVASNLSGPFSLVIATMFFSTLQLALHHIHRIFISILAPTLGLAFLAAIGIFSSESLIFGSSSNFSSSAGFGPNQVSSIMGLGVLVAFLYIFSDRSHRFLNVLIFICMMWIAIQSALTFSRGGLWGTFGAIIVAAFYLLKDNQQRIRFLLLGFIVWIISVSIIIPELDSFTNGALTRRFQDVDTTGRLEIIQIDIQAFLENPLFGLGLGESKNYHTEVFRYASAHTEYSRFLAEHGLFGIFSLAIWFYLVLKRFTSKYSTKKKAIILSLTAWALIYMLHSAMRLVAPSFIFGLAASMLDNTTCDEVESKQNKVINSNAKYRTKAIRSRRYSSN